MSEIPSVLSDPETANRLLCQAAGSGDCERVRSFLDQGLSPNGYFDAAKAEESHRAMARRMAEYRASQPDPFASLPGEIRASITSSMSTSDEEMVERFSSAPSHYEIPLFCAAECGKAECVRLILAAGADPLARDNSKRTAMYYVGSSEVARELMSVGLPLEDADEIGWSPLVNAISEGREALPRVQALIDAGANVNATHDRGYTVLMSAVGAMERSAAVLELLVTCGADPHAITELGYNAFHAAIDVNGEANDEQSVRETLTYLKQLGVAIEHRNNAGQTPLARAIQEGTGLEVSTLCELGADPNAVCPKHECGDESCGHVDLPLLFHAADGIGVHKDLKTLALLEAGADPLAKDADGFTPLEHVVAELCSSAEDYQKSYQSFFKGLHELCFDLKPMSVPRTDWIETTSRVIRPYVERFAAAIPLPTTSEFDESWRREKLSCIVSLFAHESLVRCEQSSRTRK